MSDSAHTTPSSNSCTYSVIIIDRQEQPSQAATLPRRKRFVMSGNAGQGSLGRGFRPCLAMLKLLKLIYIFHSIIIGLRNEGPPHDLTGPAHWLYNVGHTYDQL
jgi:hypothetical protein